MRTRLQIFLIMFVIGQLAASCAGGDAESKQQEATAPVAEPAPPVATAPSDTVAAPSSTKATPSVDSAATSRPMPPKRPAVKSIINKDQRTLSGYITRENVILQSKPETAAPKLVGFKRYDTVYILETKMSDEFGKTYDVPQWYKVQLANKKEGWVVARSVTVN